jgi:hypothetical protein
VTNVKDDPKFPVKPVTQGVVALLTWVVTSNIFDNDTVNGLISLAVGMLGGYIVKNPKVAK